MFIIIVTVHKRYIEKKKKKKKKNELKKMGCCHYSGAGTSYSYGAPEFTPGF